MLDPDDPRLYELMFPGAISGEAEVRCPHCGALLTVPVNDPTGSEKYACASCQKQFVVNWGE
jgi:DNA-directed RNA polymerase subunit RPC12/RpoP